MLVESMRAMKPDNTHALKPPHQAERPASRRALNL